MKLEPDSYTAEDLIDLVESGRLAIPDFQRRFVWRPGQVADLMISIARSWPIGSLLLLEGPADFAVRPLDGAPPLSEARLLILDGQQRVTALYQALGNRAADEIYVLDFGAMVESEELGDEHIKSRRRSTFLRQYPDIPRRARAGLIPLEDLVDDAVFAEWVQHYDGVPSQEAFGLRKDQLGGLMNYRVPAVRLERDIDMGALAKIFETINRTGERLRAFDLMVARLYPHQFDLADEWKRAKASSALLSQFDVDGLEILRLIALSENVREFRDPTRTVSIKGIRQGDVLKLPAEIVREQWMWAVGAYQRALAFASENCGVLDDDLLPAPTMLLPAAIGLDHAGDRAEPAVARWWWAAGFSQSYAQGANTQAVTDARELIAELADETGPPRVVIRFEPDAEVLQDTRRRNEVYLRTLMCLLIRGGATDWRTAKRLDTAHEALVLQQIFPSDWLRPRGVDPDALLNITVLPRHTAELVATAEEPRDLLAQEFHIDALATHGVSVDAISANDWQAFAAYRQRMLLGQLETAAVESRAPLTSV